MKTKVLGDKENNVIKEIKKSYSKMIPLEAECFDYDDDDCKNYGGCRALGSCDDDDDADECFACDDEVCDDFDDEREYRGGRSYNYSNYKSSQKEEKIEKYENKKSEPKEIELNNKDSIMKMINTQDFIEGYWEENEYTKKVKEKYKKEYEILKGLTDKNIDDKTAMTILVIYFINKEHSELLNDLIMIIKKANLYIQKITKLI